MKLLKVHVHGIEVFLFLKTIHIIKEIKRYNTLVPNSNDGIFCDGKMVACGMCIMWPTNPWLWDSLIIHLQSGSLTKTGGHFERWYKGVSKNRGTSKWMIYKENPIKMDDLGVPLFSETSIKWVVCRDVAGINFHFSWTSDTGDEEQ